MATGSLIFFGVLVLAGLLAVGRKVFARASAPTVDRWDGDIVAVDVHMVKNAILKGSENPLSVVPIVARRNAGGADTATWRAATIGTEGLPGRVRSEVFGGPIINQLSPRIELPTPAERSAALQQAENGGYRFVLREPFPVSVEETSKNTIRWRAAS